MLPNDAHSPMESGQPETRPPAGGAVWVITASAEIRRRIGRTLAEVEECLVHFAPDEVQRAGFWARRAAQPELVILDVDGRLDRGLDVIRGIRKARLRAPLVVLTEVFSRDFGSKIISQGIRYYFSHDYCEEEFQAVARSLLGRPATGG